MLVHPQFDPVALHLGPLAIHWYGLMYLLGFATFMWLGKKRLHTLSLSPAARAHSSIPSPSSSVPDVKFLDDLLFYGVLGVVLGGRLGEVLFYNPAYYFSHPAKILAVWEGGMSFHGGFLGVLVAMAFFAHARQLSWLALMDFIAPLCPPGLAFGRLGNFINGELWGRPTDVPWGMWFPNADIQALARHPSQLYELALEGVALFILLWLYSRRLRPTGAVLGLAIAGYGVFRFLCEFTRNPDHGIFGLMSWGISMGQWLSLPMVLCGITLMIWAHRSHP